MVTTMTAKYKIAKLETIQVQVGYHWVTYHNGETCLLGLDHNNRETLSIALRMGKKVKRDDKIATDDVFDTVSIESRSAQTIVLMLASPEEDILTKACDAIYRFVDKNDENKKLLLELNAVEALLKLIQHEERLVRKSAMMALAVMAAHADVRRLLRKIPECIPSVVNLLSPDEDGAMHEFASLLLLSASQEFTGKAAVIAAGGVAPLIRCLSTNDPDIQKNAVETLALLLMDYQTRASIRELNGFPPLLELLNSEYPVIQYPALIALQRATQEVENRAALREIDGVNRLIDFIGHPERSDLHVFAVMVLSNCLEDPKTMELIKENGGLQRLVAFITDKPAPEDEEKKTKKADKGAASRTGKKSKQDDDERKGKGESADVIVPTLPEVKEHASKAIARAAKNAENRRILHEQEVEKMLILLLAHEDSHVAVAAAQAIGVMAENVLSRDSIGRWDGIDPLIKLMKNDNFEVREAAAMALANLTTANTFNGSEISRLHGLESLITLLGETPEGAAAHAAVILTNLAPNEPVRAEMQKLGAVAALVEPLKSLDCVLQSKACLAIAAFNCDIASRQVFRQNGGVEPLVNLLKSNDGDVRRSASWAISVSAVDEAIAADIARLGGLPILLDMQQSETKRNAFTDMALNRILDSNLSAKYALTGKLAFNDIILDEFFDAGQLPSGSTFSSLEDHSKRVVDAKRAIILVNAKPLKPVTPAPLVVDGDITERYSKTTVSSSGGRTSRVARDKSKSRGGHRSGAHAAAAAAEEKQRDRDLEEEVKAVSAAVSAIATGEDEFVPPGDPAFMKLLRDMQEKVLPLPTSKDQVIALAQMVAQRMGGPIDSGQLSNFSWELDMGKLKFENKSNLVSIGAIKSGVHYHRALLFKALGDRFALGCSLVRGEYNRAWNEVKLSDDSVDNVSGQPRLPPKCYIVDLVHQPGRLLELNSPDAILYQRI